MENIFERDPQEHWPLIVQDGDMVAFMQMVSDDLVSHGLFAFIDLPLTISDFTQLKLSIDAESSDEKRDMDDYETRKAGTKVSVE